MTSGPVRFLIKKQYDMLKLSVPLTTVSRCSHFAHPHWVTRMKLIPKAPAHFTAIDSVSSGPQHQDSSAEFAAEDFLPTHGSPLHRPTSSTALPFLGSMQPGGSFNDDFKGFEEQLSSVGSVGEEMIQYSPCALR